jgi:hypothetical protein
MSWDQASARAALAANQLIGELRIEPDAPIDVFGAIKDLGLVLAFGLLDRTAGLYIPADSAGALPGILIHEGHPLSRQRFTAGHELGHHVLDHGLEVDASFDGFDSASAAIEYLPAREQEAEAFAAWFLMPRRLLRAGIGELGFPSVSTAVEAYALSLWLGTSFAATVRQLSTTRLVDRGTARGWASQAPKGIKLGLINGFPLDDTRNDVWWLQQSPRQALAVRPGDRLLVRLPQSVSSGYSWEPGALPVGVDVLADSFSDPWEPGLLGPAEESHTPGAPVFRSLLLGVDHDMAPGDHLTLDFALRRPWDPRAVADTHEIQMAIPSRRSGTQLPVENLRIPA